jgi:hypothetical protein
VVATRFKQVKGERRTWICHEEMEQARRDRDREQAVEWDRAEQEHSKFPCLKKMWDSSGDWEEG